MANDNWETPDVLFDRYNARFSFTLDAAANQDNHKCDRWFGPGGESEDALSAINWPLEEGNIWLNPPYSRGLQRRFIEKALAEITRIWLSPYAMAHNVVALLPADTSTKLFHELIQPNGEIEFLKGRITFKGASGKPKFASMVVIF